MQQGAASSAPMPQTPAVIPTSPAFGGRATGGISLNELAGNPEIPRRPGMRAPRNDVCGVCASPLSILKVSYSEQTRHCVSLYDEPFEKLSTSKTEVKFMRGFAVLILAGVAGLCFTVTAPKADAQLTVSIGVAPDCPYGYYDYVPYNCAPTGYYGPEWFNGGAFVGVGPWFNGAEGFRGNVNNRYDPQHGYKGATPRVGDKAEPSKRVDSAHFKGNEERDGRGHKTGGKK
jgi:hypothetical protein